MVIWIFYIISILLLAFFAYLRICTLSKHKDWRDNVIDSSDPFPTACGDWAAKDGCTRLVLEADGCAKTGNLREEYDIMFNVSIPSRSNKVKKCINVNKPTKNKGKKGRKKEPKVVDYDDENLSSDV